MWDCNHSIKHILLTSFAVSHPQNIRHHGAITSHLSDHELVYCVRKINWRKAPSQIKIFRNYANYDPCNVCADLRGVDWSIPNGQAASVDDHRSEFKTAFISVADQHVPVIQKRVRGVDNCPWLNKQIKSFMRQRDYFHKKANKTNHAEDWANYRHYTETGRQIL